MYQFSTMAKKGQKRKGVAKKSVSKRKKDVSEEEEDEESEAEMDVDENPPVKKKGRKNREPKSPVQTTIDVCYVFVCFVSLFLCSVIYPHLVLHPSLCL